MVDEIDEIESLLHPVDDGDPAGPNLEYEAEFQSLEELARLRPARALGTSVIASEPPEWRRVAEQAETLLHRSKDLRLVVHLCSARLHLSGLPGWATGVALMRQLLERYWDDVHPRLDADENDDPTERINAIAAIAEGEHMLARLRNERLFNASHAAHFSLRDLRIAQGVLKVAGDEAVDLPDLVAIAACLRECPLDDLLALDRTLASALADLGAIGHAFAERTPRSGPDLDALMRDLRELQAFLRPYVAEREVAPDAAQGGASADAEEPAAGVAAATQRHAIERPEDVRRMLDLLCDYYVRAEPSSPVPLLLRRAQRLVGMDFAGLLRDLAPSGISELQVVSGQSHEE